MTDTKDKRPVEAINTSKDGLAGIDLKPRVNSILTQVSQALELPSELKPTDIFWESPYATGGIGAFHVKATLPEGEAVVVKIQGPKPLIAEPDMIDAFEKQNKSTSIHAPKVVLYQPWNDTAGYEIVVMEDITGEKIIEEGSLATYEKLDEFFSVIEEYRKNCITIPWLPVPDEPLDYMSGYRSWLDMRGRNLKEPYISRSDQARANEIAAFLADYMVEQQPQFMHRHLSVNDIKRNGDGKYALFSNLFWSYRWPAYDLVFAYSWQMLSLAQLPEQDIRDQMDLWLGKIRHTAAKLEQSEEVEYALLERMLAQINFDVYQVPEVEDRKKMIRILKPMLDQHYTKLRNKR